MNEFTKNILENRTKQLESWYGWKLSATFAVIWVLISVYSLHSESIPDALICVLFAVIYLSWALTERSHLSDLKMALGDN